MVQKSEQPVEVDRLSHYSETLFETSQVAGILPSIVVFKKVRGGSKGGIPTC